MDKHIKLVKEFSKEIYNNGKIENISKYLTDDYVNHDPNEGNIKTSKKYAKMIKMYKEAIPDLVYYIDDIFEDDNTNKVTVCWHSEGTHSGNNLYDNKANYKSIKMYGIAIHRFNFNMIAETWINFNTTIEN